MLLKLFKKKGSVSGDDDLLDLPPADSCSLEMLRRSGEQVPEKWKKIDVYPPMARAIPSEPLDGILYRNRDRILEINEALGLSDKDFDSLLMPVIRNFASFVHLLPSSESHHHRGAGGALRHSLEVAFWSARAAEDVIFCRNADPRKRRKIEPLWRVAACVAGLLHDAGKPISDVSITDETGQVWHPLEQTLYEFLRAKRRDGYYISWRGGRYKRHEAFTQRAFDKIVPSSFVTHLMAHDPDIMFAIHDAFYALDDSNLISKIITWADHESVRRDAMEDVERKVGADFDYGLPVHRHIFNAIRRLVKAGKWTTNQPGAKIWHGDEGTFLVFKHGLLDIISDIKKEVGVTIRNDPDGLTDELIQRGLVRPRYLPDGEPQNDDELGEYYLYWVITPKALENAGGGTPVKLTTIKIDSGDRIFRNEAPANADIKVWATEQLGGGVQIEHDSSRGMATVGDDHVNTETGEIVATGAGATAEEVNAGEPDASPSSVTVEQTPNEQVVPSTAEEVVSNKYTPGEGEASEPQASEPVQDSEPASDPMQSLIARAGKPRNKQTSKSKKPQQSKASDSEQSRETLKSKKTENEEASVEDVLAAIDDEMDLPFGGGGPAPAEQSSTSQNQGVPGAVDEVEEKAPDDADKAATESESGQGAAQAKPLTSELKSEPSNKRQSEIQPASSSGDGSAGTEVRTARSEQISPRKAVPNDSKDVQASGTSGSDSVKPVQAKTKPKGAAPNSLLSARSPEGTNKRSKNSNAPIMKMGKHKAIDKKPSDTAVLHKPTEGDPAAGFQQLILDNSSTGAGQILERLVEAVVTHGEVLGKRWFIEDGIVAIAYPVAFEGVTESAADALGRLDKAKILKANPRQPMSKVVEIHGVMALVLDRRTSEIIVSYLKAQEQTIDPLYVPPHPDLKVVKRPSKAVPESNPAYKRPQKKKTPRKGAKKDSIPAVNSNPRSQNGSQKESAVAPDGNAIPMQNRHEMASEAMLEIVDQMIAGSGELVDEMTINGGDRSVPHDVLSGLKIRYPKLTQSLARQSFWKAAKKRGYGWSTNKGLFTLRAIET